MSDGNYIHLNTTTTNSTNIPEPWNVEIAAIYALVLPPVYFLVVGSLRVCLLNNNKQSGFTSDKALQIAKERKFGVLFWRHRLKLIGCVLSLLAYLLRGTAVLVLCFLNMPGDTIQLLLSNKLSRYLWSGAEASLVFFNSAAWAFAIYVTSREFRSLQQNGWQLRSFWMASALFSMAQVVILALFEPDPDHYKLYKYNMILNVAIGSLVPLTLMAGLAVFPQDIPHTAYQLMIEAIEAQDQYISLDHQDVLDSIGNQTDPHDGSRRKSRHSFVDQLYERQQKRYSSSTANSANTVGGMFQMGDDNFLLAQIGNDEFTSAQNKQKSVWTGDHDEYIPRSNNRTKTLSGTSMNSTATNMLAEELVDGLIRGSSNSSICSGGSRAPTLRLSASLPKSGHVGKMADPSAWDEASDDVRSRMVGVVRKTMDEKGLDFAGAQRHLEESAQNFHAVGSLEDDYLSGPMGTELRSPLSQSSLREKLGGSGSHLNAAASVASTGDDEDCIIPDYADVDVTIVSFNWNSKKKCHFYEIVVSVGAPVHRNWQFIKRYRQFLKFDQSLQATYPPKCIPRFPGKQKSNPETRCELLKAYLKGVLINLSPDALIKPLPVTACVKHTTMYHSRPFLDLREVGM